MRSAADRGEPIAHYLAIEIAKNGFGEALSMLATIEMLEAGNARRVVEGINTLSLQLAFETIRNGLLSQLILLACRPFDKRLPGDRHIGVVLAAIETGRHSIEIERPRTVRKALVAWQLESASDELKVVRHYRNKVTAHAGELNPEIGVPMWGPLFDFARRGARIAEQLHNGLGCGDRRLADELTPHREQAERFWSLFSGMAR